MSLRICLIIISLMFSFLQIRAQQPVVVNGVVVQENNTPVEFASVAVKGTSSGTTTNQNGEFKLTITTQFPFTLAVTSVGYEGTELVISNIEQTKASIRLSIKTKSEQLTGVEITSTHKPDPTMTRLDANFVSNLPDATGGTIESLVKTQMGVASNNELSSQYRVRGGNYDENLVYVNDIEIYRPFLVRSGQQEGLSFVNPEMVSSVLFSPGGFNASYGDKMSSALDIIYKTPEKFDASAQLSMLGASGHVSAITKNQKFTVSTGIRYKTNRYLLGTLDTKGDYSPTFFDAQSLLTYKINPFWHVNALVYYSQNDYHFEPTNRDTDFGTLEMMKRFTVYFEGKEADLFQTGFGALALSHEKGNSRYKLTLSAFQTYEEESYDILGEYWLQDVNPDGSTSSTVEPQASGIGIGGFLQHARNDLFGRVMNAAVKGAHRLNNHEIKWEGKIQSEYFSDHINEWEMRDSAFYSIPYSGGNDLTLSESYNANIKTRSIRTTAYILDNLELKNENTSVIINFGIRANYWNFNNQVVVSPRVNIIYKPANPNLQYRLATGLYFQPPLYKELRSPQGELNTHIKAQRSIHFMMGGDYYFKTKNRPFKFTTEAYYKKLDNLISYQVDNVRIRYSGNNDAKGYAAGIDFKINGEFVKGIESWASLSLMKTEEDINGDSYQTTDANGVVTTHSPGYIPRPADQRFNFAMMFQDYLPHNPTFKVHLNLLWASGLPFGPPKSPRYQAIYRTPAYRRVDIGFTKDLIPQTIEKPKSLLKQFQIGVDVFNLLNINNTISYYWVTDVSNTQYAVPNYLTSRRLNFMLIARF